MTDSNAETQTERVNRAIGKGYGTDPTTTETFNMAQSDDEGDFDTPFDTPFQTPRPATTDYSDQVDKQIDLETQERINIENRKQQQLDRIQQETSQHLSGLQPSISENQETRDLTRSVLNLVYKNVGTTEQENEQVIVKDEVEK